MTGHRTATREEWLAERLKLLAAETVSYTHLTLPTILRV